MRIKTIEGMLATLALSLVAFTGMATTEQFVQAATAEAAGRDALVTQMFGARTDAAPRQDLQLAQR